MGVTLKCTAASEGKMWQTGRREMITVTVVMFGIIACHGNHVVTKNKSLL